MKKLLFVFASVLMLMFVAPVNAEGDEGDEIVNMNVSIDKQSDCYVVSFPDSDLFASAKPTMEVLIDYTNAEVHKGSKTGSVVASTLTNGKIRFVVNEGGTYYILQKEKDKATVTTAPTAKENLKYTGNEQALVNEGTAQGGTMKNALGSDATTVPTDWSNSAPTGKNTGTYYVWYKAAGDADHV